MVRDTSLSGKIYTIVVYTIMVIAVLCCLVPFIYMLALSFSSAKAVVNGRVFLWPVDFTVDSYIKIFNYPNFFRAYGNTIFYTVAGTAIGLVMTILFAYPLSKGFLRGRGFIFRLVIFSMYFSGGLIPNYLLVNTLRLTNTVFAMLLPFAISQFNLIILISFFRSLPSEIEEAAIIDGLGYFGILRQIILPLSLPAIATISLYIAVFFWNDWFYGLIYLNNKLYPVMLYLRNIVKGIASADGGAGAAEKNTIEITIKAAVIISSTLPIIALYPFLQRYFVKGLTVGSVKG